MSENISSNVLFHFTKSLRNLVDILTSGFYPHYCPEYFIGPLQDQAASVGRPPAQAAPMVCFCDLPLALIKKHLNKYGPFGIGLRKKWGIKNGVSPVFYIHGQSQTFQPLSNRYWAARAGKDSEAIRDLGLLTAYMKPFHGNAWRNGETKRNVHFYNEREWRYVPYFAENERLFLPRDEYSNAPKIKALHESFKEKYKLPVHQDDIQYLIVPKDSHVLKLVKCLRNLYAPDDATLVTTAIMTKDCITQDV